MLAPHGFGESPKEIEDSLKAQFVGKARIMARPLKGKKLVFRMDGTLLTKAETGTCRRMRDF
ncbi:MAG: hypothetical protein AB7O65_12730 [Candidatus Korobacteraceae bacterium]